MPALPRPALEPPHSHLIEGLKQHIAKQRRRQKEEAEQNAALQQERKEREERKKRDAHTLENTKTQITQLKDKMESLQKEKHDLFAQLKKVVAQEEEHKKRVQKIQLQHEKDAREVLEKVSRAPTLNLSLGVGPPPPPPKQPPMMTATPNPMATHVAAKRPRSPSPQSSPYYGSPKHLNSPSFNRSPYQSYGPSPNKIPPPVPGAFPMGAGAFTGPLPPPPPPPRLTPHSQFTASGIPVITQHKQLGGITAGFPVQKQQQSPNYFGHVPRPLYGPR